MCTYDFVKCWHIGNVQLSSKLGHVISDTSFWTVDDPASLPADDAYGSGSEDEQWEEDGIDPDNMTYEVSSPRSETHSIWPNFSAQVYNSNGLVKRRGSRRLGDFWLSILTQVDSFPDEPQLRKHMARKASCGQLLSSMKRNSTLQLAGRRLSCKELSLSSKERGLWEPSDCATSTVHSSSVKILCQKAQAACRLGGWQSFLSKAGSVSDVLMPEFAGLGRTLRRKHLHSADLQFLNSSTSERFGRGAVQ
jgi:hypothetical protein